MLCLAVVHHLALTNTVPLDEIVAFLRDFAAPLVVEFPHRDDVMASRLLARKRTGVFDAYDRDALGAGAGRPLHGRRHRDHRHAHAVPLRPGLTRQDAGRSVTSPPSPVTSYSSTSLRALDGSGRRRSR